MFHRLLASYNQNVCIAAIHHVATIASYCKELIMTIIMYIKICKICKSHEPIKSFSCRVYYSFIPSSLILFAEYVAVCSIRIFHFPEGTIHVPYSG